MFTGLIEDCGTLKGVTRSASAARVTLATGLPTDSLTTGDSVAVNGVCLTVIDKGRDWFAADVSPETFNRSTLGSLQPGRAVNLERALRVGDRLGGHIVTGHVDAIGTVRRIVTVNNVVEIDIDVPSACGRYLIEKGSVAVDGISLTVNAVFANGFSLSIIPHTLAVTSLRELKPGAQVNIETDIIGKYVERLLGSRSGTSSAVTSELLAKHGFL